MVKTTTVSKTQIEISQIHPEIEYAFMRLVCFMMF